MNKLSYGSFKEIKISIFDFFTLMLFFPSVTFSILQGTEIFPYGLAFYVAYLIKYGRINFKDLYVPFYLVLLSLIGLLLNPSIDINELLRALFAYLNPILPAFAILNLDKNGILKIRKILKVTFVFLFILGILQFFGLLAPFESIIKFLVPRASGAPLIHIGRGVTLFSSEPSRASFEFIFIYTAYRYIFLKRKKCRILILWDILVIIFVFFVLKSLTGVFYLIFWLIIFNLEISWKKFLKNIFWIFLFLAVFIIIFYSPWIDNFRSLNGLKKIVQGVLERGSNGFFDLLLKLSGFRLISIIASIKFGFFHPFGGGIGNWKESSLIALEKSGYDFRDIPFFLQFGGFISVRPYSYIYSLMLDIGIFGVILFTILLVLSVLSKIGSILKKEPKLFRVVIFLLLYMFGLSTIGDPVPFVSTALILNYFKHINYQKSGCFNEKVKKT